MRPLLSMSLPIVVGLACAGAARAQGGPPMITDDPGTPGPGNWEINIAATTVRSSPGSESELPLVDINYGVGERIQLKYEVAWLAQRVEGEHSRSGFSNSLLGVKWRFHDTGENLWRISTYPQIELRNPRSHSVRRGLAEDGRRVLLPIEVERDFANVGVNFEVGRELDSRGDDTWLGGIVLGHSFSPNLELMTELHGESSGSTRESQIAANFGARITVAGAGTLLVSAGRDLHNRLEDRSGFFGYLGWQRLSEVE